MRVLAAAPGDNMLNIDLSQLPPEINALLLRRGTGVPPLHWSGHAIRAGRDALELLDDDSLFHHKELADEGMAGAIRALLYLWLGYPDDCLMYAQSVPDPHQAFLTGLAARHNGQTDEAKTGFQKFDDHPILKPLADFALKAIGKSASRPISRFKGMLEMGGVWEPFLFIDLYEQARAEKLTQRDEEIVRQIQCMEFELMFRHCFEAATGRKIQVQSAASATDQEARRAMSRRLAKRHRPGRAPQAPKSAETPKAELATQSEPKPTLGGGKITVICPTCRKALKVPAASRGKVERCGNCRTALKVPTGGSDGANEPSGLNASTDQTISVACPKCASTFRVPQSIRGKAEKCVHCGAKFLIPKKQAAAAG